MQNTVIVNGVSSALQPKSILESLRFYGRIESIELHYFDDNMFGLDGDAYVEFADPNDAARVVKNSVDIDGEKLHLKLKDSVAEEFDGLESKVSNQNKLKVVKNLQQLGCPNVNAEDLKQIYSCFGEIDGLSVFYDVQAKESLAIIEFKKYTRVMVKCNTHKSDVCLIC